MESIVQIPLALRQTRVPGIDQVLAASRIEMVGRVAKFV